MTDLAKLVVRLEGENSKLLSRLDQTNKKLDRFGRKSSAAVSVANKAFAGLAAVVSVDMFYTASKSSFEFADQLAKTADKIGITTKYLQEMQFAAERTGGSAKAMETSLQRFSRRVGEAAQGTGELKDTLSQYGIELKDSEGRLRSVEDILADYADAMQNASSDQERLRMAVKAFDQEGAFMVNTLRDGSSGLKEFAMRAHETGSVMDESLVRSAEVINDRWDELTNTIGVKFKSALISAADSALNFFKIYNNLESAKEALADAEYRLIQAEDRLETARGRNWKAALLGRNRALKDIETLDKQIEAFRRLEERVNNLKNMDYDPPTIPRMKMDDSALEEQRKAQLERMQWEETAHIKSYDAYVQSLEQRALALETNNMTAIEKEKLRYEQELELLSESEERGIELKGEYWELEAELYQSHMDRLNSIQERQMSREQVLWESGWKGKAKVVSGILGGLTTLMNTENRKMFEIGKAAATSQAIIDTIAAAQGAFKAMIDIPVVGPALAAAAAASALAAGYARVRAIQSQSFGASSGGGAVSGGGVTPPAGGATGGAVQTLPIAEEKEKPAVHIHIENITGSIDQFKDEITDIVNTAVEQTDTIVFSGG